MDRLKEKEIRASVLKEELKQKLQEELNEVLNKYSSNKKEDKLILNLLKEIVLKY